MRPCSTASAWPARAAIASRLWTKPALSIIGFDAPAVDVASNTLLPAGRAKFSLRLAPGQDPAEAMDALRRHVEPMRPSVPR